MRERFLNHVQNSFNILYLVYLILLEVSLQKCAIKKVSFSEECLYVHTYFTMQQSPD